MKKPIFALALALCVTGASAQLTTNNGQQYLLNQALDMSQQFFDMSNTYFTADSLAAFDKTTGVGKIRWTRQQLHARQAFNANGQWIIPLENLDFPGPAYDQSPELQFTIEPVNSRTVRVRLYTSPIIPKDNYDDEVMLVKKPADGRAQWNVTETAKAIVYKSSEGSIEIQKYPWRLVVKDKEGRELTHTRSLSDNDSTQVKTHPLMWMKRGVDNSRAIEPVFSLAPGERIYGCGESPTGLNHVGKKLNLFVTDPQGPETADMYKPIPFFFSNRGYGIFMHTAAPVTVDFGCSYIGSTQLFMGDENADLFIMLGSPKEILNEYTDLVGKPTLPPLWSFGTWMSRISYFTEAEGRSVAKKLRDNRIPSDVIHFDTGWFEVDWQCDYQFSKKNFKDPVKMLKDLKADGFHTCLWQLPYFTPKNRYFNELVENGMAVKSPNGQLPFEDAVLDFTNPQTCKWYTEKLQGLIKQGVSVIKVDFGEGAPLNNGIYSNGRTGFYEHNLYPVRYNKTAYEAIDGVNNEGIIWARSAWAGSQRYPLHWGGDACTTNTGLLGTVRAGLSFGLSGFSFWSNDIGGFVTKSPEELYRRWLPYGFFTSHSRIHGVETEPWLYTDGQSDYSKGQEFMDFFRQSAEMKYKLMPYIYAQAKLCTEQGLPMQRALLLEYPDDPGAWLVEDEYMFGSQMLVAPMLEAGTSRTVYLPGEEPWIDYQTGKVYQPGWRKIDVPQWKKTGDQMPIVVLVKNGSAIPHVALAQRTDQIDWENIEWKTYSANGAAPVGYLYRPGDSKVEIVTNY